jgi:hypothetical protein
MAQFNMLHSMGWLNGLIWRGQFARPISHEQLENSSSHLKTNREVPSRRNIFYIPRAARFGIFPGA